MAGGVTPAPDDLYTRAIWPVHSVDGDTWDYLEDTGRRDYVVRRDRTLGINTPELHARDTAVRARAQAARAAVPVWFNDHLACNTAVLWWPRIDGTLFGEYVAIHYFLLRSEKTEEFGRWLADTWCQAGHNLGQYLLSAGLADPFTG